MRRWFLAAALCLLPDLALAQMGSNPGFGEGGTCAHLAGDVTGPCNNNVIANGIITPAMLAPGTPDAVMVTNGLGAWSSSTTLPSALTIPNSTLSGTTILGGISTVAGPQSGSTAAWSNELSETNPGDIANIEWTSNGQGTQLSGIWPGNSGNYLGLSQEMTLANDPPDVIWPTNGSASSGQAVIHFANTTGIKVNDYMTGSAAIPVTAQVQSITANDHITLTQNLTGSGIAGNTPISFVATTTPLVGGGNRNLLTLYGINKGSVKPMNGLMIIALCTAQTPTSGGAYCEAGNDIALSDASGHSFKLVGREIDQEFGLTDTAASGSAGLYINTFNGSNHAGTGNGSALQIGGIDGFWSNGYVCADVVVSGSCLVFNDEGNGVPDSLINTSLQPGHTWNEAAIIIGNNNSAGQYIAFKGTSTTDTLVWMDASNNFNIANEAGGAISLGTGSANILNVFNNGGVSIGPSGSLGAGSLGIATAGGGNPALTLFDTTNGGASWFSSGSTIFLGSVGTGGSFVATLLTVGESTKITTVFGPLQLMGYTVGGLPAGASGEIAYVTDQLTVCPALGGTFTGGGSVKCLAFYNGTAWIYP